MTAIRDDLDNSAIIGVGISMTFVVAFLVLILNAWFLDLEKKDISRKAAPPETLTQYKADQAEKLGRYGWVDQAKGQVRIPLDRAKALTVKAINTPAPAPAAAPDAEATETP